MHFWNIFGDCVHFSLCFPQFHTFLPVLTEKKRLVAFHRLSFSIFPNTLLALDMWITHSTNSFKCRALRSMSCTFGNTSTLHYVRIDWALKQINFSGTDRRYVDWTFTNGQDGRPSLSQVVKSDYRFHPQRRRKYRQLCREGGLSSTFSALAGLPLKAYSSFLTFVTSCRTWQGEIAKGEIAFSALWSLRCDFNLLHQKEHIAQFLPSRHSCVVSVKKWFWASSVTPHEQGMV